MKALGLKAKYVHDNIEPRMMHEFYRIIIIRLTQEYLSNDEHAHTLHADYVKNNIDNLTDLFKYVFSSLSNVNEVVSICCGGLRYFVEN